MWAGETYIATSATGFADGDIYTHNGVTYSLQEAAWCGRPANELNDTTRLIIAGKAHYTCIPADRSDPSRDGEVNCSVFANSTPSATASPLSNVLTSGKWAGFDRNLCRDYPGELMRPDDPDTPANEELRC